MMHNLFIKIINFRKLSIENKKIPKTISFLLGKNSSGG